MPGAWTRCRSRQCRDAGKGQVVVGEPNRPGAAENGDGDVFVDHQHRSASGALRCRRCRGRRGAGPPPGRHRGHPGTRPRDHPLSFAGTARDPQPRAEGPPPGADADVLRADPHRWSPPHCAPGDLHSPPRHAMSRLRPAYDAVMGRYPLRRGDAVGPRPGWRPRGRRDRRASPPIGRGSARSHRRDGCPNSSSTDRTVRSYRSKPGCISTAAARLANKARCSKAVLADRVTGPVPPAGGEVAGERPDVEPPPAHRAAPAEAPAAVVGVGRVYVDLLPAGTG